MRSVSARPLESLERWSPGLFLAAGGLLAGYAALNGVAAATELAYESVEDVVGPAGFVLGLLGLLGLYPSFADRRPRLARAGAGCATLGAVGFSAIASAGLLRLAGVEPPAWLGVFVLCAAVGMVPGYLAFGVANRRTDGRSGAVGLLLLVPAAMFTAMLAQAVLFDTFGQFSAAAMAWSAVALSGGQALAHLAIGHTLRTGAVPHGRRARSGEATTG